MTATKPLAFLEPAAIEEFGRELDAIRDEVLDDRGERDRALHPAPDPRAADARLRRASRHVREPRLPPVAGGIALRELDCVGAGSAARHARCSASPRSSRTWRSRTTSCTRSGTGCAIPRSSRAPGSGTRSARRTSGGTRTTSCTTPGPTCSARIATSATACCASPREQRWSPFYLLQPLSFVLMALFFEWFIAVHDLEINRIVAGKRTLAESAPDAAARSAGRRGRQVLKDYVLWPALAGPFFLWILAANALANVMRNLWTFVIIFCGHFPAGVHNFSKRDSPSTRPVRAGMSASCSARATSAAAGCSTSCPAT